eukprot:gene18785-20676_t
MDPDTLDSDYGMPCSKRTLFSYDFKKPSQDQLLPTVQIFLYKAKHLYDDRFSIFEKQNMDERDEDEKIIACEMISFNLSLARAWSSRQPCKTDNCLFIKQVYLKPGNHVYLYRINGEFQLADEDNATILGTKRKVNFINVSNRFEDQALDFKDLEYKPRLVFKRPRNHADNSIAASYQLTAEDIRTFNSIRDFYDLKIAMHAGRLAPLEMHVWKEVCKSMMEKMK